MGGKLKLLQPIKGLPESSLGMNPNTVIMNSYEQFGNYADNLNKPIYALYCLSGHKMCAGRVPITSNGEFIEKVNLAPNMKEVRVFTTRTIFFYLILLTALFLDRMRTWRKFD